MGYSISWFAIPTKNSDEFLKELRLATNGETEDVPESAISLGRLDNGWSILWCNAYDCPFMSDLKAAALSENHDLLWCKIEEHLMASSAELWSGGQRKWLVAHEGDDDLMHLEVAGDAPETLPAIRKKLETLQLAEGGEEAGIDYLFEIPLQLAEQLVGFKHDENQPHLIGNQYHVLKESVTQSAFFQKLFGRK